LNFRTFPHAIKKWKKQRVHLLVSSPDIRKMQLEQMLLIGTIEETNTRLHDGWRLLVGKFLELICISAKEALGIIEDIKHARLGL